MAALTLRDWQTINTALVLLDDRSEDPSYWAAGEDESAFVNRVQDARRVVLAQLRAAKHVKLTEPNILTGSLGIGRGPEPEEEQQS